MSILKSIGKSILYLSIALLMMVFGRWIMRIGLVMVACATSYQLCGGTLDYDMRELQSKWVSLIFGWLFFEFTYWLTKRTINQYSSEPTESFFAYLTGEFRKLRNLFSTILTKLKGYLRSRTSHVPLVSWRTSLLSRATAMLNSVRGVLHRLRTPTHVAPVAHDASPLTLPSEASATHSESRLKTRIALYFGSEKLAACSVDTVFGLSHFKGKHSDAQFLSARQFKLYKGVDDKWLIAHDASATNQTLKNGNLISRPELVEEGMVISVGNVAKRIEKLKLILKFE